MTEKQAKWYEDKLAAFVSSQGMRYELVTGLTYAAAACGLSPEEVIDDCRARMPDFKAEHAANIRRGMASAHAKLQPPPFAGERRKTAAPPPVFPNKVKDLIKAGGMKARLDDLLRMPCNAACPGLMEQAQTQMFLRALYEPADLIHIEASQRHEAARLGVHLRTLDEWLKLLTSRFLPGDILGRNPYSGEMGATGEGNPSLVAASCVTTFKYALIEFDHLPLAEQCAFWLGFFRTMPKLSPFLVSLVFSGGKSIHGLLRVNADRQTAPMIAQSLRRLFCSDPEKDGEEGKDGKTVETFPYRADPMGFAMRGGTRLAGARRMGSGELQRLLYLKGL